MVDEKNTIKVTTLITLINLESTLTEFEKFHPPQKEIHPPHLSLLKCLIRIIAEPNEDFSHGHFEQ